MKARRPAPLRLAALRALVDVLDDGLIVLLAARRQLVAAIAAAKARAHIAASDPARERYVHNRALRLALRLRVPVATVRAVIQAVVADARRQQDPPHSGSTDAPAARPAAQKPAPSD